MEIQKVTEATDLAIIQKLAYEIWPICYKDIVTNAQIEYMLKERYNLIVLTNELEQNKADFYIAYSQLQPVGFASISKVNNQPCKLNKLYVITTAQGLGIGKALFKCVKQEAILNQAPNIYLQVNRANAAVQFYKAQGMQIIEEKDVAIGNGFFMNDYIMELPLLV